MDRFLCDYLNESLKKDSFDNLFSYSKKKAGKKKGIVYYITSMNKYLTIQEKRSEHYAQMLNKYKK